MVLRMSVAPFRLTNFFAAAVVCALAGQATADCLTADDLRAGIVAEADDGLFEVFRAIGPNMIELTIDFGDGVVAHDRMAHGVYLTEGVDYEYGQKLNDTLVTVRFPAEPSDLPLPAENTVWNVAVTGKDSIGRFREDQEYRWGSATNVVYNNCRYVMIPGTIRTEVDGFWTMEDIQYLPELGLSLQLSFSDADDQTGYRRSYLALRPAGAETK